MVKIILFAVKHLSILVVVLCGLLVFASPNQEIRVENVVIRNQGGILEARQGQKLLWQKQSPGAELTWVGSSGRAVVAWSYKYKQPAPSNAVIIYAWNWKTGKEIWRSLELNIETRIQLSGRVLLYHVGSGAFAVSDAVLREAETGRLIHRTRSSITHQTQMVWHFESSAIFVPHGSGDGFLFEIFVPQTLEVEIFQFRFPNELRMYFEDTVCTNQIKQRKNPMSIEYIISAPCGKTGYVYFRFPFDRKKHSRVVRQNPKFTIHEPPPLEYRFIDKPEFP